MSAEKAGGSSTRVNRNYILARKKILQFLRFTKAEASKIRFLLLAGTQAAETQQECLKHQRLILISFSFNYNSKEKKNPEQFGAKSLLCRLPSDVLVWKFLHCRF